MDEITRQRHNDEGFALKRRAMPAPRPRAAKPEREGTDSLVTWLAQDCVYLQAAAFFYPGPAPTSTGCAWYTIAQWKVPENFGQEAQLLGYDLAVGSPDTIGEGYCILPSAAFSELTAWKKVNSGAFGGNLEGPMASSAALVIGRNMRVNGDGSWTALDQPTGGMRSNGRFKSSHASERIVIPAPTGDLGNSWSVDFVKDNKVGALSPAVFPLVQGDTLSVCAAFGLGTNYPAAADEAWCWPVWIQLRIGATVSRGGYTQ